MFAAYYKFGENVLEFNIFLDSIAINWNVSKLKVNDIISLGGPFIRSKH